MRLGKLRTLEAGRGRSCQSDGRTKSGEMEERREEENWYHSYRIELTTLSRAWGLGVLGRGWVVGRQTGHPMGAGATGVVRFYRAKNAFTRELSSVAGAYHRRAVGGASHPNTVHWVRRIC
jgi:hypothetical protein